MAKKMEIKIKEITTDDLRRMEGREGIVFEGCADLQSWIEGLNDTLTEAGVLLNGTKLQNVSSFQRNGLTCLLFDFEGAELNIGKFAMWRLQTHGQLGGTWLSDYVPNRLDGFIHEQKKNEKPVCELVGQDGNIYNLLGIASRTLKECGLREQADEMWQRVTGGDCHDYHAALGVIGEYVNITGPAEQEQGMTMEMGGLGQ